MKETQNSNLQKVQNTKFFKENENLNSEVYELEKKLEEINEEEKLKELREQLNKKRLERNLISLDEFEQLQENITYLRLNYKNSKNRYQKQLEEMNKVKSDKYIYSSGLLFLSGLMLNWVLSQSAYIWISLGSLLFILFFSLGLWNFRYRSQLLKDSITILEKIEIEKQENLSSLKKAKKYLKDNDL